MAGPTDVLTEDVKDLRESNRELAAEIKGVFERLSIDLREQNQRSAMRMDNLESAIRDVSRDLGNFRADITKEFGGFRADITKELGAIRSSLESLRVRLDDSVPVAKWTVGILAPIVIGLVSAGFWLTWQAAKLDSRVERVEMRLGKQPPVTVPMTKVR